MLGVKVDESPRCEILYKTDIHSLSDYACINMYVFMIITHGVNGRVYPKEEGGHICMYN